MSDHLLAVAAAIGLGLLALGLGVASLMWSLEMLADRLGDWRAAARGPRIGQAQAQAQADDEPPSPPGDDW